MCSGIFGGGDSPHYETPQPVRVDPTPTPVQSADVEADNGRKKNKNKQRRAAAMTRLSTDRDSILGGLTSGDNTKRDKLG